MLYIVATPIGNLGDISKRALETLETVSLIACEDVRQTRKLLSKYSISTKCVSCHSHNQERVFRSTLLPLLQDDKDIALLSDAGTPCLSDPGAVIVELAQSHDIIVCPIPGASAVSTIMSVAGLHGKGFYFEGFLQRKSGARRKRLEQLLALEVACVLFESPYRITKLLDEIHNLDSNRTVLLGREMTKKFEQFRKGTASQLLEAWNATPSQAKGECSVVIYPSKRDSKK